MCMQGIDTNSYGPCNDNKNSKAVEIPGPMARFYF